MALSYIRVQCELRWVVLRDKAEQFLKASISSTVPTLVLKEQMLEESFDVMRCALQQSDPEEWLDMPAASYDWLKKPMVPLKWRSIAQNMQAVTPRLIKKPIFAQA